MNRSFTARFAVLLVVASMGPGRLVAQAEPELLPTEALHRLHVELQGDVTNYQLMRQAANDLLPMTRTEGLDAGERFALAELRFNAFDGEGAERAFSEFAEGNDDRARLAFLRLLQIRIASARGMATVAPMVAAAVNEFYDRFDRVPTDPEYGTSAVMAFARIRIARRDFDGAIEVLRREIDHLSDDAAYSGYLLPATLLFAFETPAQKAEVLQLIRRGRDAMTGLADRLRASGVSAGPDRLPFPPEHRPGVFHRLENGLASDWPAESVRLRDATRLAERLDSVLVANGAGGTMP